MCTGRVDLSFVVRAFLRGADGVIIGGCWPGECHYVTEGNYDALGNLHLGKLLLGQIGLRPERFRLEWIAASEGSRFAEVMSDFARQLKELGPLGEVEGLDDTALKLKLEAVNRLIPYLRLVEREKLRVATRSEKAYKEFYESAAVQRLLDDLIADKLVQSQILLLLGEGPRSSSEISEQLGLTSSAVARHMNSSSGQGLVRYDEERASYALA